MEFSSKFFNLSEHEEERARKLHEKSIIIDTTQIGPPVWNEKILKRLREIPKTAPPKELFFTLIHRIVQHELFEDPKTRQQYIDDVKKSGVTAIVMNPLASSVEELFRTFADLSGRIANFKEILSIATCAKDISRAKTEGKLAFIFGSQNTEWIGQDLGNIDLLYKLGIRIIQLTYNRMNMIGLGCTERYRDVCGLSYFGLEAVERMNKLGIVVDTGHSGYKTTLDAVDASKDPVIASHTACRAVYDHHRNKTDEEIKAIAKKGGYIGIYTLPSFLAKKATIKNLLDHTDHAVEVAGADHVGIGMDYGNEELPVPDIKPLVQALRPFWTEIGFRPEHKFDPTLTNEGIEDFTKWPNITRGLISRGYSDKEVQGIIGGNFLRVFKKIVG